MIGQSLAEGRLGHRDMGTCPPQRQARQRVLKDGVCLQGFPGPPSRDSQLREHSPLAQQSGHSNFYCPGSQSQAAFCDET